MTEELIERVARAIHDGLGGNGWAYFNYGYNEWDECRGELNNAARAALTTTARSAAWLTLI